MVSQHAELRRDKRGIRPSPTLDAMAENCPVDTAIIVWQDRSSIVHIVRDRIITTSFYRKNKSGLNEFVLNVQAIVYA